MQLSFWDLYSLFDKEYNSVIKEAAEKTGLTMNELGVLLFYPIIRLPKQPVT